MRFKLFLIVVFTMAFTSLGKEPNLYRNLQKIKVFESTRKDVEKLFKYITFKEVRNYNLDSYNEEEKEQLKKNPLGYYSVYYELKDGRLNVTYSKDRCSENNKQGYDLKEDTVINIYLLFDEDIKLSEFDFDLTNFKKDKPDADLPLAITYTDKNSGIELFGGEEAISGIEINPTPYQAEKYECENQYPTDEKMEKIFHEKKDVFEKLVQMSNEDPEVSIITNTSTVPITDATNDLYLVEKPVNFSKQRWDNYKRLFKEINAKDGLNRADERNPGAIVFTVASKNYSVALARKGYVYTKEKVEPLVDSIDSILEKLKTSDDFAKEFFKKDQRFYKRIADNWYLYFDYR